MAAKSRSSKPTTANKPDAAAKRKASAKARPRSPPLRRRASAKSSTVIQRVKEVLIAAEHAPTDALRDRLNRRASELVDWDEIRNAEGLCFLLGEDSVFAMPKLRDEFDLAVYLAAMVKISTAEPALRFTIDLGDGLALRKGRFEGDDRAIKEEIARVRASRPNYEGAFRRATITLAGLGARLAALDDAIARGRRNHRWRGSVPRWSTEARSGDAIVVVELDSQLENAIAVLQLLQTALGSLSGKQLLEPGVAASIVLDGSQRLERACDTLYDLYTLASDLSVGRSGDAPKGEWLQDTEARTPITPTTPVVFHELAPMLAGRTLRLGVGAEHEVHALPDGTIQTVPRSRDDDDERTSSRYTPDAQAISHDGRFAFFRVSPVSAYLRDLTSGVDKAVRASTAAELRDMMFVDDELIAVHYPRPSLDSLGQCTLVAISTTRPSRQLALKDIDELTLISQRGIAAYLASRNGKPHCGEIALRDFATVEHPIPAPEKSIDWRERKLIVLPSGRVLFTVRIFRKKSSRITTELFALENACPKHQRSLPPMDRVFQVTDRGALVSYTPESQREDLARIDWHSGALTSLLVGLAEVPDCGRILVDEMAGGAIRIERRVRRLDEKGGGVSVYATALIDETGSRAELKEQMRFADAMSGEPQHEGTADGATLALASLWTGENGPRIRLQLDEAGRTPVVVETAWPFPVDESRLELGFSRTSTGQAASGSGVRIGASP